MHLKFSIISFALFVSLSLTDALKCDDNGYTHTEGVGWHKFHTDAKNWLDASHVCTKEGAHLAIINSEKEHKLIIDMFNNESYNIDYFIRRDLVWLGGQKMPGMKQWSTVFGKPLSSTGFEKWGKGCNGYPPEPNNALGDEFCLSLGRTCNQGFNDQGCNTKLAFVCEKLDTCDDNTL